MNHPCSSSPIFTCRILLALLASVGTALPSASANLLTHPWTPDSSPFAARGSLGTQLSFFNTRSNWDRTGAGIEPNNLLHRRLVTDLNLTFHWTDPLSLFGRMSVSGIQNQDRSGKTPGRFGWADQTVGIQYRFELLKDFHLRTQFRVDFPTYAAEAQPASLGDGSWDWTGGGFLSYTLALKQKTEVELFVGAGMTYRTHFYSTAFPWLMGIQINSTQSPFYLRGSLQGSASIKSDPHSYTPNFFRQNLGQDFSLMTGAMNPSWAQGQIIIGYQRKNQVHLGLSFTRSLWGQMTPQLTSIAFCLAIPLQPEASRSTALPLPSDATHSATPQPVILPITAKVLKSNERLGLIKINQGSEDGVLVGDRFHIFSPLDSLQRPLAIATVIQLKSNQSALEISEYLQDQWISEDCIAKKTPAPDRQKTIAPTFPQSEH